jgi:Raf kinase inhibitor-like YbhB/YbcL family protein
VPGTPEQSVPDPLTEDKTLPIAFTSSAFAQGQLIPLQYSCQGLDKDISPPLSWGEPPSGTQSFALIMDDPDAPGGIWDHWLLFNIPPSARGLPASFPANPTLPDGSMSGNNSWGKTGYGGPCPPSGTHRYFFKLYALDETLAISAGATKGELEKAMVGHILAQGELMGIFAK